jgi:hemoglobin-like flavoprotein
MAITERQKQLVRDSFKKVEPISDVAAGIFYDTLFSYDPSLKGLFKGDMKSQGKKLMAALKLAVNTLDNLEALVPVLQKMAVKHVEYGVKVEDYTPVGNALMKTLETGLADAFTSELRAAWVSIYKVMVTVMREAAYPSFNASTFKNTKRYNH